VTSFNLVFLAWEGNFEARKVFRSGTAKSGSSLPRISAGNPPYTGYTGPLCRFI